MEHAILNITIMVQSVITTISLLAVDNTHELHFYKLQPTTSYIQSTLRIEKYVLRDPDPHPSSSSRTYVLPVLPTLIKHKSWKTMMDTNWDSIECIFKSLGLIVSWLLAVACRILNLILSDS